MRRRLGAGKRGTEIAQSSKRFRELQLEIVSNALRDRDPGPWTPLTLVMPMSSVSRFLRIEEAFDIDAGHAEITAGWRNSSSGRRVRARRRAIGGDGTVPRTPVVPQYSGRAAIPPPEKWAHAMTTLSEKAAAFRQLHRPGDPVILPTVWDAWSARLVEQAGFRGVTVGSHPLADSLGRPDGEGMSFAEVLGRVREITAAVDIPVSLDIESGYGLLPEQLVDGLLGAEVVGLNIEDTVHSDGGRLREAQEHADFVGGLRQAADAAGVPLVVNARTDLFLRGIGAEADRVDRAVARLRMAAEAGADVLYPVGFHDPGTLRRLCAELPLPVNAVAFPDQGDRGVLAEAGVARVSFGPFLQRALSGAATELLERWR